MVKMAERFVRILGCKNKRWVNCIDEYYIVLHVLGKACLTEYIPSLDPPHTNGSRISAYKAQYASKDLKVVCAIFTEVILTTVPVWVKWQSSLRNNQTEYSCVKKCDSLIMASCRLSSRNADITGLRFRFLVKRFTDSVRGGVPEIEAGSRGGSTIDLVLLTQLSSGAFYRRWSLRPIQSVVCWGW